MESENLASEDGREEQHGSGVKLDFSPRVIHYGDITHPIDFASVFDLSKPIEVDIGCGMGRFITARAQANPDVQYIGVERQLPRVRRIDRKAGRLGLQNLFLVRLEAAYTLKYLFPEHAIRRFYLLFPDPWPKRRHARHRIFNADFRSLVWSRLVPGGELQVATDHLGYFEEMRKQMEGDVRFEEIPAMERDPSEQTDFELKFRQQGLPIGAAGYRARLAADIGQDVLDRYAAEDAAREADYWANEMPHFADGEEWDADAGGDGNAEDGGHEA